MKRLSTELNDRTLRFDGVSILDPERVPTALAFGVPPSLLRVTELSEDVLMHNSQVSEADRLKLDEPEPVTIPLEWRLPERYKVLDLEGRILDDASQLFEELKYTPELIEAAGFRIDAELSEIRRRGMTEFMRTIIYVLDTFRQNKIVWGVGRGSSCACYILFILGLHAVDSLRLEVPLEEFFHD